MKHREIVPFVLLFAVIMSVGLCAEEADEDYALPTGPLQDTRVVILIAPKDFNDTEYTQTFDALKKHGARIIVASAVLASQDAEGNRTLPECVGTDGLKVTPLVTLSDTLEAAKEGGMIDAVVFIGGPGAAKYIESEKVLELARTMKKRGKTLAAICIAPAILAKAGILEGRNATVWENNKKMLIDGGANYTGKDVEVDGRIITANGPAAAKKFAETIAGTLLASANARAEAAKAINPAMGLVEEGDYDKAQALLEKAQAKLEKSDPLARLHILMAQVDLYIEEGKDDEALKRLHVLLAAAPQNELTAQATMKAAIISLKKKDTATAEKMFKSILLMDADPYEEGPEGYFNYRFNAYRGLAKIYTQANKPLKTIEMLLAALNENFVAFDSESKAKKLKEECSTGIADATNQAMIVKSANAVKGAEFMAQAMNARTADEYFFNLGMAFLLIGESEAAADAFAFLKKHYPDSIYIDRIPEEK